ncbi:MAG: hypothetical protein V3V45_06575 [Candidatus Brocadiales bacterium]
MTAVSDELIITVRRYQVSMLKQTYRDLMEDEGLKRLVTFLLDTVYAPEDTNTPSEAFHKVYDYFVERPKGKPIAILTDLLELNRLTDEIDRSLAENIGKASEITDAAYETALRACNNRNERERHIELFAGCVATLHRLTRHPLNTFMFKVIKLLMSYVGHPKAIKIVEEGYGALLGVEDISRFIGAVKERELGGLGRVYGNV